MSKRNFYKPKGMVISHGGASYKGEGPASHAVQKKKVKRDNINPQAHVGTLPAAKTNTAVSHHVSRDPPSKTGFFRKNGTWVELGKSHGKKRKKGMTS